MSIVITPLYNLEVRYIDDTKGFGVFTNENIEKGNIVEICYSLKLKKTEIQHSNHDIFFLITQQMNTIFHLDLVQYIIIILMPTYIGN